jgi:hypothetical protein
MSDTTDTMTVASGTQVHDRGHEDRHEDRKLQPVAG